MSIVRSPGLLCAVVLAFAVGACTSQIKRPVEEGFADAASITEANGTVPPAPTANPDPQKATPDWVKRVEIKSNVNDEGRADVSVLSLQPLYQPGDKTDTVFTEVRVNRNGQAEEPSPISNLGLGYRRLLRHDLMAGLNGFYDRDWRGSHHRAGADAEIKWKGLDFNVNYYVGLDGSALPTGYGVPRTLDGYNLEVASQLPYLPWARAHLSNADFFTAEGQDDHTSYTTGMQLGLMRNLQLDMGIRDDLWSDEVGFVKLNFRIDGMRPKNDRRRYLFSKEPIATAAFESRNLKSHTLDRVRRIDTILRDG